MELPENIETLSNTAIIFDHDEKEDEEAVEEAAVEAFKEAVKEVVKDLDID